VSADDLSRRLESMSATRRSEYDRYGRAKSWRQRRTNVATSTHFLGAVEPHEKGANSLVEAIVQALQNPGQATHTKRSLNIEGDSMEDNAFAVGRID